MHYVYILYSLQYDKFYIGQTHDIEARLAKHNSSFYKNKYTSFTDDWEYFWFESCSSKEISLLIEKHIKKMKSRKYIQNLKKYPEIFEKLLNKYSD